MNPSTKILIGAVATALLAGATHGPLGMGKSRLGLEVGRAVGAYKNAQRKD